MNTLERFIGRGVQYVGLVPRRSATGLIAEVYAQAEREFQLAPPLTVHSPAPRLLAAVWSATRETLIVGDGRVMKEAIAASVSAANACPYCVDVHSVMLEAGSRREVAVAIAGGRADELVDEEARATLQWSLATPLSAPAGTTTAQLGTAIVFHYVNRVVNVFMREGSPLALPSGLGWLRGGLSAVAARTVGRTTLNKPAAPGASLGLLADLEVRSGIRWIDEHPTIGPSLARLFAVAGEGVRGLMSAESRATIEGALLGWRGEDPPLGRGWLDRALAGIHADDVPGARLALLTARCAYQVGTEDVALFRACHASDEALVQLVGFGAAAAARRVATWLGPGEVRS